MNISIILSAILLLVFQNTCAQKMVMINSPNFNKLNPELNKSTLIDWVYDGRNRIYYKFQIDDRQLEFFQISDSIYRYREKKDSLLIALGQYTFKPTDIDTSFVYSPGQYEQELRRYVTGDLYPSDQWSVRTEAGVIRGKYSNGLKEGSWEFDDRTQPERVYSAGKLVRIFSPDADLVAAHFNWIEGETLLICHDMQSLSSLLNQEYLRFQSNVDGLQCPGTSQAIWSDGTLKLSGFEPVFWQLEGIHLHFSTTQQTYKFKIILLGEGTLSLVRVVPDGQH